MDLYTVNPQYSAPLYTTTLASLKTEISYIISKGIPL